ncbi:hypothetical protein [Cytophaga aurantiaca]|uniref:hypothetical protein n=1 Tax=Cytophaga aurantiaca TaxID=29530 RepID=UPI00037548AD|nr:hypothetical protein [Cytophaga aurantiaca]
MATNHIFNEKLKRFEPIETSCQFCNKRSSDKMDRNYFVPVFREEDRTDIIVYSSVKFKKVLIGIPRCTQCFVIHQKSVYNSWIISVLTGIVCSVLGFVFLGLYGVFVLIPAFVLSIVAPMLIDSVLIRKKGILTPKDGAMKDPLVQDLVISGWSLNQPSPR